MSDARAASLRAILDAHARGELSEDSAQKAIRSAFEKDLGFARIDTDRASRRGFPEVVYGAGKTLEQLRGIVGELVTRHPNLLCTRVDAEAGEALAAEFESVHYDEVARVAYAHGDDARRGRGTIGVVVAGTSDLPVAREAALCAEVMGNEVKMWTDVGVAGLHRLLGV
ncbi:MAG: 1-(5-phosphoribosyl)-5-amino-4-imidazole-carboxylate carboxylase, partial [Nannocystaceae bacterium]